MIGEAEADVCRRLQFMKIRIVLIKINRKQSVRPQVKCSVYLISLTFINDVDLHWTGLLVQDRDPLRHLIAEHSVIVKLILRTFRKGCDQFVFNPLFNFIFPFRILCCPCYHNIFQKMREVSAFLYIVCYIYNISDAISQSDR